MGIAEPDVSHNNALESFHSKFPALRDKRLILFLGRIHMVKGCDLLIEAFARVHQNDPDLRLVMAGPDPGNMRPTLEELSSRLGISERICWTGMLTGEEKWGAIYAAEAVTLASHHENFSFSTVEALACHKPVLLSNQVGIWREVDRYHAGLIGNDDLEGTVDLLTRWLALTEEERQSMAANARRCFLEQFEVEAATRGLLEKLGS